MGGGREDIRISFYTFDLNITFLEPVVSIISGPWVFEFKWVVVSISEYSSSSEGSIIFEVIGGVEYFGGIKE